MSQLPKISCCMITEGRSYFREWAIAQVTKQTYPPELIEFILCCSPDDTEFVQHTLREIPNATVVYADPGSRVPVKRNLAKAEATGELVTWFDDDDWSAAQRLEVTVQEWLKMKAEQPSLRMLVVDSPLGYFDFHSGITYPRLFSSWQYSLYERGLAQEVPFPPRRKQGSDAHWVANLKEVAKGAYAFDVERRNGGPIFRDINAVQTVSVPRLGLATSHGKNICNTQKRLRIIQVGQGVLQKEDYLLLPGEWEETVRLLYLVGRRLGVKWPQPITNTPEVERCC